MGSSEQQRDKSGNVPQCTRAEVERDIIQFLKRFPRYQSFDLPCKRGVLLAGPPGTGKTLLGKVVCSVLPTTFIWVSPGEISNPHELQRLFALARELQPTILFLEDLDLYAGHRGNGSEPLLGNCSTSSMDSQTTQACLPSRRRMTLGPSSPLWPNGRAASIG